MCDNISIRYITIHQKDGGNPNWWSGVDGSDGKAQLEIAPRSPRPNFKYGDWLGPPLHYICGNIEGRGFPEIHFGISEEEKNALMKCLGISENILVLLVTFWHFWKYICIPENNLAFLKIFWYFCKHLGVSENILVFL